MVARQLVGVDRVVLVHEQRVEQLVVTGDAVDLAERQVLVLEGVVVGALQLLGPDGQDYGRPATITASSAKWNRTFNLTAIREPERMITHHVLDALAVLPYLPERPHLRLLDVGSGGGVPALPLAIARPSWHVVALDSSHKKGAFLQQAVIELALPNVETVTERVEDYAPPAPFDVVISRAFSDLVTFAHSSARHLAPAIAEFIARHPAMRFDIELSDRAGRDVTDVDPHRPFIDDVTFACPTCAQTATRAFMVSIETGVPSATISFSTGARRAISSAAATGFMPTAPRPARASARRSAQAARVLPTPEKTIRAGSPPAAMTRASSPPETMSNPLPRRARMLSTARLEFALTA